MGNHLVLKSIIVQQIRDGRWHVTFTVIHIVRDYLNDCMVSGLVHMCVILGSCAVLKTYFSFYTLQTQRSSPSFKPRQQTSRSQDPLFIGMKVLTFRGPVVPRTNVYYSFCYQYRPAKDLITLVMMTLRDKGLGQCESHGHNHLQFIKCPPDRVSPAALEEYGVRIEDYTAKYSAGKKCQ